MNQEEEILQSVGESVEFARQFAKDQVQLLKLEMAERTAKLIASLATMLAVMFIGSTALLFLTISLALIIGNWIDSTAAGFAIVGGVYIVLGIIVNAFKKDLVTDPILTVVIRQLFD